MVVSCGQSSDYQTSKKVRSIGMAKNQYVVGPGMEAATLASYRNLLDAAYANGEAKGGSMDWNDVQAALEKAVEGLGGEARLFMDDAAQGEHEDGVKIEFADGTDISAEVWSASLLLLAYRYPEDVKWEDVDAAWEALHRDPAAAIAP